MQFRYLDKLCDTPSILSKLKLKNINKLVIGHLNIISLPGKFDQLKVVIENNIDIPIATETKIDSSFSSSQFMIKGFSMPFRFDRNRSGGGVIIYDRDDISSKQLTKHKLPDNIEGVFIEVNLRKIKWLIFSRYHPTVLKGSNSIRYCGPIIWSLVPEEIRYTDSIEKFKNKIRRWKSNNCPCLICTNYIPNVGFLEIFEYYFIFKIF